MQNFKSTSDFIPILIVISISIVFFMVTFFKFGDLMILSEARDYIKFGGWVNNYYDLIDICINPVGSNTRTVSLINFKFMKSVFGYNHVAINIYQITIIILSAYLLYVHCCQIIKRHYLAVVIVFLWLFSMASTDSISWQATNHDKTAAFFVFATLVASYHFLKATNKPISIILSNIGLTVLLCLAYNSKEASFFLMPLIFGQYVIFSKDLKTLYKNDAVKLVLPLIFSLYYIIRYFIELKPDWAAHTLSNSAIKTIYLYGNYLINHVQPSMLYSMISAMLFLFPCIYVFLKLGSNHFSVNDEFLKIILYSLLFFISSIAIALKTRSPSVYYMLIPSSAFIMLNVSFLSAVWIGCKAVWQKRVHAVFVVTILSIYVVNYIYLYDQQGKYARLIKQSKNMRATYQELSNTLTNSQDKVYVFHFPRDIDNAAYVLRGSGEGSADSCIMNFLFQQDGDYQVKYGRYTDGNYPDDIKKEPFEYHIVLDNQYRLLFVL